MENFINKKHKNTVTMHTNSSNISKTNPKIRIIHIFAPQIIKTDVANFRDLVQRLTGKPTGKMKSKPRKEYSGVKQQPPAKKTGIRLGLRPLDTKMKGEEEIWVGSNPGGEFLGGFGDMDGFMQELHHHHHGFAPMVSNSDPYTFSF